MVQPGECEHALTIDSDGIDRGIVVEFKPKGIHLSRYHPGIEPDFPAQRRAGVTKLEVNDIIMNVVGIATPVGTLKAGGRHPGIPNPGFYGGTFMIQSVVL